MNVMRSTMRGRNTPSHFGRDEIIFEIIHLLLLSQDLSADQEIYCRVQRSTLYIPFQQLETDQEVIDSFSLVTDSLVSS